MTDNEIVQAIQRLMSGKEWSPDTLDAIADLLIGNGYHIKDVDGNDIPAPDHRIAWPTPDTYRPQAGRGKTTTISKPLSREEAQHIISDIIKRTKEAQADKLARGAPYPFCHHPEKCAVTGRCMRDPVCND